MEQITVQEALRRTVTLLEGTPVPVKEREIAERIRASIDNITACIKALDQAGKPAMEEAAPAEDDADGTEA